MIRKKTPVLFYSILLSFLLTYPLSFGQADPQKIQQLINSYYHSEDPGGILAIKQPDKNEALYFPFGMADLDNGTPIDKRTNFRMASLSKNFTAFAISQLLQDDYLKLDQPISDFFPDLTGTQRNSTIGQLLNHHSGIPDYENHIPDDQQEQVSDSDVYDLIKNLDQTYFTPGSDFRYSNTAFCLLTLVVEKTIQQPYADYMAQKVFGPQSLQNTSVYEKENPPSHRAFGYHPESDTFKFADQSLTSATKGDGSVYIAAPEFIKWGEMYIQLFKEDSAYSQFFESNKTPISDDIAYALGWFLLKDKTGNRYLVHSGETTGFNNIAIIGLDTEWVLSLFTNRDDLKIAPFFQDILQHLEIEIVPDSEPLFSVLAKIYAHSYQSE